MEAIEKAGRILYNHISCVKVEGKQNTRQGTFEEMVALVVPKGDFDRLQEAIQADRKHMFEGLDDDGEFVVRVWDGMDGCWCDVSDEPLTKTAAIQMWMEKTENGTKAISFDDIDYYKIFPYETTMMYSGNNEMFR
jgi:hypothetical protein